jgi:hypothetical protein
MLKSAPACRARVVFDAGGENLSEPARPMLTAPAQRASMAVAESDRLFDTVYGRDFNSTGLTDGNRSNPL